MSESTTETTVNPLDTLLAITEDPTTGRTWLRDLGTGAAICLVGPDGDLDRLGMVASMLVDTLDAADPETDYVLEEYDAESDEDDDEDDPDGPFEDDGQPETMEADRG